MTECAFGKWGCIEGKLSEGKLEHGRYKIQPIGTQGGIVVSKARNRSLVCMLLALTLCLAMALPGLAQQRVTLTVWGRDLPDDDPAHAYIRALVNGFQQNNPDINLDYIALGDPGIGDRVRVVMASNSGLPDIFQSWGGSVMGAYADAGRLLDLTDELESIATSDAARQAMSWKGKTYGVAPFFAIAGVFVNEGIFEDLGLEVPETIEEMEEVAEALLAAGYQPFALGARDQWPVLATYMYLVNRYGGIDAFADAQARRASFDGEAFVTAAEKYREWYERGFFGSTPLGEAYGDAQLLMATGQAGMHVTGSWMNAQYSDPGFTDQTIGFYPFPVLNPGDETIYDVMGQTDIGFAATHVAAEKKDAVVRFMQYAMSLEAVSAEAGRITSVPDVPPPSRLTGMAADIFGQARNVQFWWDQDLPPMVTTPLNTTIQKFLLPNEDIRQALREFEQLAEEHLGPVTP